MSREIEFRAWDIEAKKMRHIIMNLKYALHGLIACQWCDGATLDNHWLENNADCVGGKDGFILMQYTGLKDKNGVEIFDGDIVRISNNDYICKYRTTNWSGEFRFMILPHEKWFDGSDREKEIIGNIHQNPELLEGK